MQYWLTVPAHAPKIETVPSLYRCQVRCVYLGVIGFWIHTSMDTLTRIAFSRNTYRHKGVESCFVTGDTQTILDINPIIQIGWFQLLKGYVPNEWISQRGFHRSQTPMDDRVLHRRENEATN
jgi:hypothetical protein